MSAELVALWERIGAQAGDDTLRLLRRLRAAALTDAEVADALTTLLAAQNLSASAVAEALAVQQLTTWGEPAAPAPAPLREHQQDSARLRAAAGTVLARQADQVEAALERLARAEAVEAGQVTYGAVVGQSPAVRGWIRQLEPDACELCRWWSRDGRMWPPGHRMPTHKGCTCAQRFIHK